MKKRIKVGGEDAGEISVKPITLIYDGTYGTQKIEIEDEFPPLNCRELPSSYGDLTDEVIKQWIEQPFFVYCWWIMWGGNLQAKDLAKCLPESREEFENAADNVKYMFAFLSAFLYRWIQAKGKPFRVQYPEIGLHPGVQANLGDLFIIMKDYGTIAQVSKYAERGKDLLETFCAKRRLGEMGI